MARNFILFLIIFYSCAGRRLTVRNVEGMNIELQMSSKVSDVLYGKWLNSYEEELGDGTMIYRPANFPFPESRARIGIEFLKEGKFIEFSFLPDDRPFEYKGEWIYSQEMQTIEVTFHKIEANPIPITVKSREGYVLEVVKLENGLLKVKKRAMPEKESDNGKKN